MFGVVDLEDQREVKFTYLDEVAVEAFANIAASALANVARQNARQDQDRLHARLQGRADLYALFAHEFKSPLNSLALGIGRCLQLHDKSDFDDLGKKLSECEGKLKHAIDEVDDMLRITKDAENLERYSTFELGPIIQGAWGELREQYPDYQVEIHPDLLNPGVRAHASAVSVKVVIKELIKNAAVAAKRRGKVKVSAYAHGAQVCLAFHDDGPGIPHGKQDEIWRMGTSFTGSTGHGLTHTRRVMRIQLGDLTIDEECKNGARFILSLPVPFAGGGIHDH